MPSRPPGEGEPGGACHREPTRRPHNHVSPSRRIRNVVVGQQLLCEGAATLPPPTGQRGTLAGLATLRPIFEQGQSCHPAHQVKRNPAGLATVDPQEDQINRPKSCRRALHLWPATHSASQQRSPVSELNQNACGLPLLAAVETSIYFVHINSCVFLLWKSTR